MRAPLLILLIMMGMTSLSLAGCVTAGAVPRPFPSPDWNRPVADKSAASASAPDDGASASATGATADKTVDKPVAPSAPNAPSLTARRYDGRAVAQFALRFRGVAYRPGGADPAGFDCSGLVQYVFAQYGVFVPRIVEEQYEVGDKVRPSEIRPGDLLFFATKRPDGVSHVAISIGGDQFVHAPNSTGVVRIETLSSTYWGSRYVGARRLTPSHSTSD
jgi:cell wall-associated NlpC family hydrolase